MPKILVNAIWDKEAKVWVATSDQVPGLVTEAETAEALEEKLSIMIPELLMENGLIQKKNCKQGVPYQLLAQPVSSFNPHSK